MSNTKYLEWVATVELIVATAVNSAGIYPLGPILLILGGILWLIIGLQWKKHSIVITNAVMVLSGIGGVAWKYLS